MNALLSLVIWIRRHVKWLWPFAGAVAVAVKPILVGGDYTPHQILFAASLVAAAYITWVVPNEEAGVAKYSKAFVVIVIAGITSAETVLPGGVSRADWWTIGTAIAVSAGTLLSPTITTRSVKHGGFGRMGDGGGIITGFPQDPVEMGRQIRQSIAAYGWATGYRRDRI